MVKILGLDLGTNSLGWAITERNEDGYELLDRGVDIFQEGVNRTKSGEEPMVKNRTDARALRRHYFRRRLRKIALLKILIAEDMCPRLTEKQLDAWRYEKRYPTDEEFLLWQRTDDNTDKNPYHDRFLALTTTLDLKKRADRHLLGRAIYHLAQRRGFLSNRKDSTDDKERGKVIGSIGQLSAAIKERGCEFLGEYFYELYRQGDKIRTHYTARKEHYEAEFNAICDRQNLPAELRKALHKEIFFQRPLKSQKGTVGNCTFEKGKPRCPISHPRFEEFRMLSFINNIRVKSPADSKYRPLTEEEVRKIEPLFYRKSKEHFDFEEIAKKIAGKGGYSCNGDMQQTDALFCTSFNFSRTTSVSGCPVTVALMGVFGDDWATEIHSLYMKGDGKTREQIVNDVWHALFSFDDEDKLRDWAKTNLQLTDEQAKAFAKIRIPQDYAALSLKAINKILPYLRRGFRYDEAVFLANLSAIVPKEVWNDEERRTRIEESVLCTIDEYKPNPYDKYDTKKRAIIRCLGDCGLTSEQIKERKLYHPSMIETYKSVQPDGNGALQLGLPFTKSIRNPMVMRSLFRLRALVNRLLKEGKIDKDTKVNIEFARELNTSNMRRAIERMQRENEAMRRKYADEIRELYKKECGAEIEPTDDDILKYKLWNEQNQICLYTGKKIGICDFLGVSPSFDIEHTVPRSRGGEDSQSNKTLCECRFNRYVKGAKLPAELANYDEIMARIEALGWKEKIDNLHKQIYIQTNRAKSSLSKESKDSAIQERHYLTMQLEYWEGKEDKNGVNGENKKYKKLGKYTSFKIEEIPEGFSNSQGVGIGIIGRYARLYLKTVFDNIYIVKGETTENLRKAWGLQKENEKKDRSNHVHHCIDAVTIACVDGRTYSEWKKYIEKVEAYDRGFGMRLHFRKPWETFTEDVKSIADELLVAHHTADRMANRSRKKLRVRGKIQRNERGEIKYAQGDTARGALHQETFYGAIKRNDEIKYVVRKPLSALSDKDIDNIVDGAVRECVKEAVAREGFKEAMSKPICFNAEKGVYIKKVRIFTPSITRPIRLKPHRDESRFEYKRNYHVANDSNYCMAIYEGTDAKGRTKRSFELVNNLEAAAYFNGKSGKDYLVPQSDTNDYPLKYILRTGTMVLFYENSPEELYECTNAELSKRLYKIIGLSSSTISIYTYGTFIFKHHQEARQWSDLKIKKGVWKIGEDYRPVIGLLHTQLNAYVEGYDFELTVTGEVKFKH